MLKELPAETEGNFLNVRVGQLKGDKVSLKIRLFQDNSQIGESLIEKSQVEIFQVTAFSQTLWAGVGQWYTNYIWIRNISGRNLDGGYRVYIVNRDKRLSVYNKALIIPALDPNQDAQVEFYLAASANGNYSMNIVDVTVVDTQGNVVLKKAFKAPVSIANQ